MSTGGVGAAARRGIIWSTLAFAATRGLSFVSTLILARLLAPREFGVVAAIVTFLALIELASDLGLGAAVVYEQESDVSSRVQTAFTVNLVVAAGLAGLGVALSPLIASFFRIPQETDLFRLASLSLLLTGLGNIQDALLLRELAFKQRLRADVTRSVVRAAVSIALAVAGLAAESLVIGMLVGTAAWTVSQWAMTRFRPTFEIDRGALRAMGGYGAAATALEVLSVIANRADVAIVGRILGDSALGLYTVAFRVPELLVESVAWNLSIVAFPALSRYREAGRDALGIATLKLVRYMSLYAVPVGAGMAVLAQPLIVVLFGDSWKEAGGVLGAVAVASAAGAVGFPVGDVFKAVGRQRVLVLYNVISIPLWIALAIVVAPAGIVAVAWARAGLRVCYAWLLVGSASNAAGISGRAALNAVAPAFAAGVGVAIGAGAVRLAWPADSLGPLLCGTLAGTLGGAATLRLAVPGIVGEMRGLLGGRERRIATPAQAQAAEA